MLAIGGVLVQRHNVEVEKAQAAADSAQAALVRQREQAKADSLAREKAKADSLAQIEAQKQLEAAAKAKWSGTYVGQHSNIRFSGGNVRITLTWNEARNAFTGKAVDDAGGEGVDYTDSYSVIATIASDNSLSVSFTNGLHVWEDFAEEDSGRERRKNCSGTLTQKGNSYVLRTSAFFDFTTITLRRTK